jgi:MFS family permease
MVRITIIRFGDRLRPAILRVLRAGISGPRRCWSIAMSIAVKQASSIGWRTPAVVLVCGCLVSLIAFGPRSSLGFFLIPMSQEHHWGRDVFSMALAIQNLLWGVGQPFAGGIADRYGANRVLIAGALLYAAGLALMAHSTNAGMLDLSAGVLIGFGLSGSSFTIVLGAFGKLLPPEWRSLAFGAGTAAGSFGQFLYSPIAVALMDSFGWKGAVTIFAGVTLVIVPLAMALATPKGASAATPVAQQSLKHALGEAFSHRSYVLLVLGFFTCGFQLAFTTVHLPSYLVDRGLSAQVGGWTLATIGLFNIIGSIGSGFLGARMPKRYILSVIYFARALSILIFISLPPSTPTTLVFGAVTGLLWLSTVPPTSGIVATMFGTQWLAMLFGFAFFSHQVGGFLGVWLGGIVFDYIGSYNPVWYLSIFFGVMSALLNLPIVERPVERMAVAPA